MAMRPKLLVLAFGAAMLSQAAQAQSITYTDTAALSDVDLSGVLSVSKFDPSLGTLTGVSWSITGAIASILGISNDGSRTIQGSAFTSVDFELSSAPLSLAASPDFNVLGSTGLVTLGIGESVLFPITAQTTISGTAAPAAAFLVPGTIDLAYMTSTSFGGSGFGGDITISQATDAGVSFSITYDYRTPPVPEASTFAMAGIGLIGLWLVRRRRH